MKLSRFFTLWFVMFIGIFGGLYASGLVPAGVSEIGDSIVRAEAHKNESAPKPELVPTEKPADFTNTRIIISAIDVDSPIIFPESRDINILNDALLKGVVYYPGSALPGEKGKTFLFGHSSGLPVIHNQAYKSFNGLRTLKTGDIVLIKAKNEEYRYRVLTMRIAEVDNTIISFDAEKPTLVLLTCKLFGDNSEKSRYIVEAEFMGNYPLPN